MDVIENGVARTATAEEQAAIAAREAGRDAALPAEARERVKAEATRRILAIAPEWKQRNMTARGAELLKVRIENAGWTAEQQDEADALTGVWASIKAVRLASDAIEASFASMTPAELRAFDATDDAHWEA